MPENKLLAFSFLKTKTSEQQSAAGKKSGPKRKGRNFDDARLAIKNVAGTARMFVIATFFTSACV